MTPEFTALKEVAFRRLHETQDGCSQTDCGRRRKCRNGLCGTHYERVRKHGDSTVVLIGGGSRGRGALNPNWQATAITYRGAHMRVRALKGRASERPCEHCDGPALDWAYDHLDPDEKRDPRKGSPYSTDESHYIPLCRPCHRRVDANALR